jgi:hypothetical protein
MSFQVKESYKFSLGFKLRNVYMYIVELKRISKINIRIFVTTILFVFEYSSMLYTQGSKVFPKNGRRHFQNRRWASGKAFQNNPIFKKVNKSYLSIL